LFLNIEARGEKFLRGPRASRFGLPALPTSSEDEVQKRSNVHHRVQGDEQKNGQEHQTAGALGGAEFDEHTRQAGASRSHGEQIEPAAKNENPF